MTDRLEYQIRKHTEAVYATARPLDQLAPAESLGSPRVDSDAIPIALEPSPRSAATRPVAGLSVAIAAAAVVLLIALPTWLLYNTSTNSERLPAATVTAPIDLFVGEWSGIDSLDGSRNILTVGDSVHIATYQESGISACMSRFGQFAAGSVSGPATADGTTLTFTGTLYCSLDTGRTVHPEFQNIRWTFDYSAATGTITLRTDPKTSLSRSDND
jgi:hypothetical protein